MIFYGNPGLGKSTFVIWLCKELYKIENDNIEIQNNIYNDFILFLNAWYDRGIQIVRQKIKWFISYKTTSDFCKINYKTIIFEEADALSLDCQSALWKVIENNWENTRFLFICNYINNIKNAIISRCLLININNIEKNILDRINNNYVLDNIDLRKINKKNNDEKYILIINEINKLLKSDNFILDLQNFLLNYIETKKFKIYKLINLFIRNLNLFEDIKKNEILKQKLILKINKITYKSHDKILISFFILYIKKNLNKLL
jgi:DNA polymerase III delta prime subunit